jgi:hypothetical protein
MAPNLRLKYKLCIGIYLCIATNTLQFAHSQAASGTPSTQDRPTANGGFGENPSPELLRVVFTSFLLELRNENRIAERELAEGQIHPSHRLDWVKILQIDSDSEQAMCATVAEANIKLAEIESQSRADPPGESRPHTKEENEAIEAIGEEIGKERNQLLDETIARLRGDLGNEGFNSLEAYLYRTLGYDGIPGFGKPSQPTPGPAAATAKEPQP